MASRRIGVSILGCALGILLAGDASAQPLRKAIYASVLDASGNPVSNVTADDLTVREDKIAREVLEVWPASDGMEIALLIDNSQASDAVVRNYREALPAFINALAADETGARHQVAVVTLADRPTLVADYSLTPKPSLDAVQRLFAMPGTGTYLLDGIIETSRGVRRRNAVRPVIVVVTTEGPELSTRPYQTVLEPLRASGAQLHVIIIGRPINNDNDRALVIGMGTKDSGGSYDNIFTGTALVGRMKQLANELTHQFKVTYARPDSLIPPEQVTIGSARPGLTVRGTPARDTQAPR